MTAVRNHLRKSQWVGIAISVLAISIGHYATSMHAVVLHEVFTRLYYLPIVFAALAGGAGSGVGAAVLTSALYLPHVIVGWHAWPAVQVGQYGEVVVFLLIGAVAGHLSTSLRTERDRAREASERLEETLRRLEASVEDRLRVDRLVTVGQIAAGMAHEIRNPLAAARGALEILESRTTSTQSWMEFTSMAQQAITRASLVLNDLLEFAQPRPPAVQTIDLRELLEQTTRLSGAALSERGLRPEVAPLPSHAVYVSVDTVQMQRVLVTLLLEATAAVDARGVRLAIAGSSTDASLTIDMLDGRMIYSRIDTLFELFSDARVGHGLTLALAKRLVENQGGQLRVEPGAAGVRCVLEFPRVPILAVLGLNADWPTQTTRTPGGQEIATAPMPMARRGRDAPTASVRDVQNG